MTTGDETRSSDLADIAAALDAAHARANAALVARNVPAYLRMFHPDLAYTQVNGRTINHRQLALDVSAQFARLNRAHSTYQRQTLEKQGSDRAREVLEQVAEVEMRAFGVLHRAWRVARGAWRVRRRGDYEWTRTGDCWQIFRVMVHAEKVEPIRTWVSLT